MSVNFLKIRNIYSEHFNQIRLLVKAKIIRNLNKKIHVIILKKIWHLLAIQTKHTRLSSLYNNFSNLFCVLKSKLLSCPGYDIKYRNLEITLILIFLHVDHGKLRSWRYRLFLITCANKFFLNTFFF